jgi:hypothetical protein
MERLQCEAAIKKPLLFATLYLMAADGNHAY